MAARQFILVASSKLSKIALATSLSGIRRGDYASFLMWTHAINDSKGPYGIENACSSHWEFICLSVVLGGGLLIAPMMYGRFKRVSVGSRPMDNGGRRRGDECCPNCVLRRHALDAILKEIADLEAESCATAERADRIQRHTISNMSIFDDKLEEASMELAASQQVMNELIREDNFMFFAYGASFAGNYAEVVEVASEGNTPPTQENSKKDFAPVITRCGNCDHITEEMSRAIDSRASLCVRQSRDRARIARIESDSNDSFQLANERLKDVRKFAVAASVQCNALQTSLRRSYQSLYGESYPPLTDQEARSGVHHATPNDNSSSSERFVAPLFRTMGRPAP
ncbi:unnamed protein product [Heligmosomoides polygyrus]|uniref:V-type proton ATPase subunit a n=1 Tax=Heligmosomoides polygyrus TaxID=6339 RepID=A0A183GRQ4_HELPZ|nr:unnamed protein product [Heligmosomoides polygyrus]